ncbi:MAG: hypothetical protein WCG01_05070, partial [bacterium]
SHFLTKSKELIYSTLIIIFSTILKIFSSFKILIKPNQLQNKSKQLVLLTGSIIISPISWFFNLKQKQRLLIFTSLIFLILFGLSIVYTNNRNKQLASSEYINSILTQIEQKENLIDSSLIYKNDEGAINLAKEVKILISQVSNEKEINPKLTLLKNNFAEQEKKIKKIISVNPKVLANIGGLVASAEPQDLTKTENSLYSSDNKNHSIYKIDLGTKIITTLSSGLEALDGLKGGGIDENLIYYKTNDKIFILNIKKDQGKSYLVKNLNTADIIDVSPYLGRLFVLNKSGDVLRLNFSNETFSGQRNWLNEKIDTNNLAQFYIDGAIYFLYNNGNITKFSRGTKQAFSLSGLEPALNNAKTITTSDNNIFIGSDNLKAIAVFDNKGVYQKMYQSDKFSNITSLQIDEKNKLGYVLADKIIYSFELK